MAQARCSTYILVLTALLPVTQLGFASFSASPAFAADTIAPEQEFVTRGATHFVAVDGSDDGPGTAGHPWANINFAAEHAQAGDTVVVRGGRYVLAAQARVRNSGRSDAWITFMGYPGERAIFDAQRVQRPPGQILNNGAFQIEGVSYIRVVDLTVINSHDAGFTVRDSSNIDLINNATDGTYSSGIAVWDTNHEGNATKNIRILGNSITRATTFDLLTPDVGRPSEPPHEAISIGGAVNFEVAYNHVFDSDKEGIDIKETSRHGKVHHNLIHTLPRQGIYVDAWFGAISDIEIYSNVVHDCRGAGLVLSVENGTSVDNVKIHHNLVFENSGSGLYFSRWGVNNLRSNIEIANNTFYHNGYGPPKDDQAYYWMTGGLYLYTTNLRDISIRDNIFSDNRGFQIGYSELYLKDGRSWQEFAREQNVKITDNLIDGRNTVDSPIESGGNPPDRVKIYAVNGDQAIFGDPLFKNPTDEDFTLRRDSPAAADRVTAGAYAKGPSSQPWWKQDFPPKLVRTRFDQSK